MYREISLPYIDLIADSMHDYSKRNDMKRLFYSELNILYNHVVNVTKLERKHEIIEKNGVIAQDSILLAYITLYDTLSSGETIPKLSEQVSKGIERDIKNSEKKIALVYSELKEYKLAINRSIDRITNFHRLPSENITREIAELCIPLTYHAIRREELMHANDCFDKFIGGLDIHDT